MPEHFEQGLAMSDTAVGRFPILIVSGLAGLLLAGTVGLWAHYGTTVFFEVVRAGIVACFG